jgi:hypothetical protein
MVMNKTHDPQLIAEGIVKPCRNNADREIITATINLSLFQLVLIVNVPIENEDKVKIYYKFKVARDSAPTKRDDYHPARVAEKNDAREDEYEYSNVVG